MSFSWTLSAQQEPIDAAENILLHIWGNDDFFAGRSLDVFITRLRKYLRHDPEVKIMNIRGVGYKIIS